MSLSSGMMSNPAGAFSSWMMRRTGLGIGLGMPESRLVSDAAEAEEKAARQIWELKTVMRSKATSEEFYQVLVEGLVEISGAQAAFVSRCVPEDDKSQFDSEKVIRDTEPMVAIAYYFDDGIQKPRVFRNYEYETCSALNQDRVVLITNSLSERYPLLPDVDPLERNEAYLSVPIWVEGECYAHMGLVWTEGRIKSKPMLSWGFLTMFLHALEDMVQNYILTEIASLDAKSTPGDSDPEVPHCCKISLKPYARNVSHELRTPMQGVVGTLDLLHLILSDICTTYPSLPFKLVNAMLENIEIAQDSSMKAIYAADNMVHAYDLDMEIPNTAPSKHVEPKIPPQAPAPVSVQENHRRRSLSPLELKPPPKAASNPDYSVPSDLIGQSMAQSLRMRPRSYSSPPQGRLPIQSSFQKLTSLVPSAGMVSTPVSAPTPHGTVALIFDAEGQVLLNSRPVKLREFLHNVIHECLRIGGRPDTSHTQEEELGESVTVLMKGATRATTIQLQVAYEVPDFIIVDELALKKLISCVFHNAIKFACGGKVVLTVSTVHPSSRFIIFSISDNGCGIKSAFLPNLFKPFSREDTSITRTLDGLGLGLMVAKGLARKMGGDVWCEWTSTKKSPGTGTEFRIKIPTSPANSPNSLPGTPLKTPCAFISTGLPGLVDLEALDSREPLVDSLKIDARRIVPPVLDSPELKPTPTLPKIDTKTEQISYMSPPCSSPNSPQSSSIVDYPPNSPPPPTPKATPPTLTLSGTLPSDMELPKACIPPIMKSKVNIGERYPSLRVLVTEDNAVNRKLLVSMLLKLGLAECNILTASDGLEAIQVMEADRKAVPGGTITYVLMDIWMPRCDGFDATKRILALDAADNTSETASTKRRQVEILAVSADVTRENGRRAIEVGMVGFMPKPYRMTELQRVLLDHATVWHDTAL
ncbi:hypothetical protein DFH27DRAFT_368742 [Peziza echinospora]|nr:hypothetical protein DFH27DRAFT_368742 [Peziza echinospora]